MKWVKASLDKSGLPDIADGDKIYFIKYYTTGWEKETGGRNLIIDLLENGWQKVYYLEEKMPKDRNDERSVATEAQHSDAAGQTDELWIDAVDDQPTEEGIYWCHDGVGSFESTWKHTIGFAHNSVIKWKRNPTPKNTEELKQKYASYLGVKNELDTSDGDAVEWAGKNIG